MYQSMIEASSEVWCDSELPSPTIICLCLISFLNEEIIS